MSTTTTPDIEIERLRWFIKEELDAGGFELPVLPDVATKVQETARKPYSTARQLAAMLKADGTMAAHILKMANSARYAGVESVTTLDGAIARLGSDMVVNVVIATAGKAMFKSEDPNLRRYLKERWCCSAFSAAAARHYALRTDLKPDQAFLGGLMMWLGEPVLVTAAERLIRLGRIERPPADQIVAAVGPLIPEAGAKLMETWRLPDFLVAAVRHQGDFRTAPPEHIRHAALLQVAGDLARLISSRLVPSQIKEQMFTHPGVVLLAIDREKLSAAIMEVASEGRELMKLL